MGEITNTSILVVYTIFKAQDNIYIDQMYKLRFINELSTYIVVVTLNGSSL